MNFDRPNKDEIERLSKTFILKDNNFLPNVSLQELILNFQELAGDQVDILNVGRKYAKETNHVFVLCREKVKFLKPLKTNKNYTLVTYPLTPGKLQMQREAYLLDEENNVVMLLDSIWVLVDFISRRMLRTTDVVNAQKKYPKFDTFQPIFDEKLEEIENIDCTNLLPILTHKVGETDLDVNAHMNNTVYLKLIQKFIDKQISTFEIDYEKECRLDDELRIYKQEKDNFNYFVGKKQDDSISFKIRIS